MGHRADATLHSGEGTVHAVSWAGALIAWANDAGVKLYDADRSESVAFVDRPRGSPAPELHAPRLAWDDGGRTLIIGWADCVKIATVGTEGGRAGEEGGTRGRRRRRRREEEGNPRPRDGGGARDDERERGGPRAGLIPSRDDAGGGASGGSSSGGSSSRPRSLRSRRVVEVTAMFQTEYVVAGVAPLGANLVVLAEALDAPISGRRAPAAGGARGDAQERGPQPRRARGSRVRLARPRGRVPRARRRQKSKTSRDEGDWGDDAPGSGSAASFHVVAPRDVVRVTPRTAEDRVRWFVQRGAFEKALAACEDAEAAAAEAAARGVVGLTSSPFALSAPLPAESRRVGSQRGGSRRLGGDDPPAAPRADPRGRVGDRARRGGVRVPRAPPPRSARVRRGGGAVPAPLAPVQVALGALDLPVRARAGR